ncbi:MAG: alcohol dehydrogenase catalytic domain-containing protein [Caldilineaceae bacterium]
MLNTRVVYLEPGKLTVETITLPELKPNEVLIKTHQASVCGSERYFYQGINVRPEDEAKGGSEFQLGDHSKSDRAHAYPMGPLGHEGGGVIEAMGAGVEEYLGGGKVRGRPCRQPDLPHLFGLLGLSASTMCSASPTGFRSRWAVCTSWAAAQRGRRSTPG